MTASTGRWVVMSELPGSIAVALGDYCGGQSPSRWDLNMGVPSRCRTGTLRYAPRRASHRTALGTIWAQFLAVRTETPWYGAGPSGRCRSPARTRNRRSKRRNPLLSQGVSLRADDQIRTGDPHLGKVMLYQLSHVRVGAHYS